MTVIRGEVATTHLGSSSLGSIVILIANLVRKCASFIGTEKHWRHYKSKRQKISSAGRMVSMIPSLLQLTLLVHRLQFALNSACQTWRESIAMVQNHDRAQ